MGEIIPFPKKKRSIDFQPLTRREKADVMTVLRERELATYVGLLDAGRHVCIFDDQGNPYSIGREETTWYLFDPNETMLHESQHFEHLVDTLESTLKYPHMLA